MLEPTVVEDKKYRYELLPSLHESSVNDEEIPDMGWDEDDKNWEAVLASLDRPCSHEELFKFLESGPQGQVHKDSELENAVKRMTIRNS